MTKALRVCLYSLCLSGGRTFFHWSNTLVDAALLMYGGWLFAAWSLSAPWAGCWATRTSLDPAWPSLQHYLQGEELREQQHLHCVLDPDSDRKKKVPCGFATNTGVLLSTEQRWAKEAAAAAGKIQITVTSGNGSPLLGNELLFWSWWPIIIYKSPAWCLFLVCQRNCRFW